MQYRTSWAKVRVSYPSQRFGMRVWVLRGSPSPALANTLLTSNIGVNDESNLAIPASAAGRVSGLDLGRGGRRSEDNATMV